MRARGTRRASTTHRSRRQVRQPASIQWPVTRGARPRRPARAEPVETTPARRWTVDEGAEGREAPEAKRDQPAPVAPARAREPPAVRVAPLRPAPASAAE